MLQDWKKLHLLHFTCMWCLWFVFCPSYALKQLIEFMVSPSCGCICFIIRRHLCILIHLSILWSTAGRCETFDKLWSVYFAISFKDSKTPFEPPRRWDYYTLSPRKNGYFILLTWILTNRWIMNNDLEVAHSRSGSSSTIPSRVGIQKWVLREKPLGAKERTTSNSNHIWRRRRDLNLGHTGGRRVLSLLLHPCSPIVLVAEWSI